MMAPQLTTSRLLLGPLDPKTLDPAYVGWLNDPSVNRYLEVRRHFQTMETVRGFVEEINASTHSFLFGLFLKTDKRHIGNIKLGPIDAFNAHSGLGILIGARDVWSRGFASEALGAIVAYADTINLKKIFAGGYAPNEGSFRMFMRNNFVEVGRLREHRRDGGGWVDEFLVERINDNFVDNHNLTRRD